MVKGLSRKARQRLRLTILNHRNSSLNPHILRLLLKIVTSHSEVGEGLLQFFCGGVDKVIYGQDLYD